MFTGLIESVGRVAAIASAPAGRLIRVRTDIAREVSPGDSVAVNGVCLTVVTADGGEFGADLSPETLRVTALGSLREGALVNLERPIATGARFGGHFVQGHVDATGTIEDLAAEGEAYWLAVSYPGAIAPYLVPKGSIAIDGISLTIARLAPLRLGVQIVPFTFQHTNLQAARPGDTVNVECDILGKYVVRALEVGRGAADSSAEKR